VVAADEVRPLETDAAEQERSDEDVSGSASPD